MTTIERDITERKKSEEEIRILSKFPNENPNPVMRISVQGKILFANKASKCILQMWGKKAGQVLPKSFKEIVLRSKNSNTKLEFESICGEKVFSFIRAPIIEGNYLNLYGTDITERKKAEIVLQEKVEDLRRMATVVTDSNDAVIMHDFDGKILAWNRGAKETYGYSEAEALGKNVREIVAKPDREAALSLIKKIKQGEVVKSFELRRVTKDGRILDVWLTTTLLTDEKGKPVAIATTERDITERKKAEINLQEKVEGLRRMATVVTDSNDAVILHDFEGKILAWNRGAKETYGYSEAEALGKNVREIVAEPDREAALSLIKKIKQGEVIKSFELRRVTKDGRILDVWLTTTLLTDEKGKPAAIATTERDITERKAAEKVLMESESRYHDLFEESTVSLLLEDFSEVKLRLDTLRAEGITDLKPHLEAHPQEVEKLAALVRVLDANRAAIKLFKARNKKDLFDNLARFRSGQSHGLFFKEMVSISEGKTQFNDEGGQQTLDGNQLEIGLSWVVDPNRKGDLSKVLVSIVDLTQRIQAEEKLKTSLNDLERSNKDLEQFAYVASHDLQEPLRMVASYTQLLEKRYKDKLDSDALEFINYAVTGANRMQGLINDLLSFSRVGTRAKPSQQTDSHIALGQARKNLSATIEENHAIVTNDDLPEVMADESQLVQLFQNLIGNAIKFHNPGESPCIHISAQRKKEDWVFSVHDNGIGIDPQYFDRIFIIFQRLNTREEYQGTGIGLAICKKIVERLGGKIWVESQPGQGSTFYFTLK